MRMALDTRLAKAPVTADLPPCGGDVRQDRGGRRRAPTLTAADGRKHLPTILRFWNDGVIRDIDNVCQHIVIAAGLVVAEVPAPPMEELVL